MKLKYKALIFLITIHLVVLILSLPLINTAPYLFIIAEVGIVLSIIFSVKLYKQLVKPLDIISFGISSMEEGEFNTKLNKYGHREWDRLIDLYNSMIDNLKIEQVKLKEKNYFLEKLIMASPSGIIILDDRSRVSLINPFAKALLGDCSDKTLDESGSSIGKYLSTLESNTPSIYSEGAEIYRCIKAAFMDKGYNHYFIIIEELSKEIRKREKLAYEKVVRVMSHEVGNSTGAINSIIESTNRYLSGIDKSDNFRDALGVAMERNRSLYSFMQRFSQVVRLPEPELDLWDLNSLVNDCVLLFSSSKDITWELDLYSEPILIKMDKSQIEQVVINILKNSVEAIRKTGFIKIKTGITPVKFLEVEDNGIGIEDKSKLFTPFYSNKSDGQGVGLTLIKEILLKHSFNFSLNSGKTTLFRINFS